MISIELLLTSAVVGSIIAALAAIYSALVSSRASVRIEEMNQGHELRTYKYDKIYTEYLTILEIQRGWSENEDFRASIGGNTLDDEQLARMVAAERQVSEKVNAAYDRIKPMLNDSDKRKIDEMIAKERSLNTKLETRIESDHGSEEIFNQLRFYRVDITRQIIETIFEMLNELYSTRHK